MSDQPFTPPTLVSIDIPDIISDTASYITGEELRISVSKQQNASQLARLQTLAAQVQAQIDAANAVSVKLDADESALTVLRGTQPAPVVPTPPPDELTPPVEAQVG